METIYYTLGFDRKYSVIKRLKNMCDEKGIGTLITEIDGFEALILVNNEGKCLVERLIRK